MLFEDYNGPSATFTQVGIFLLLCLVFAIFIYFLIDVSQPYVKIINYKYKSNYYKPFVLPDGYDIETQGRKWSQWDDDTPQSLIANDGIRKMCKLFNESAGWANVHPNRKNARLMIKLWEDFIKAFLVKLESTNVEDPSFQGFPWGYNWYEFSITIPTNFAYYIVHKLNSRATNKWAARSIQLLIKDPEHSIGYKRDKANSAMMVFPWTLSHMITGTLDTTNPSYMYAVKQYDLTPKTNIRANEDGIHLDYSYLTHGGVYAFGYLWSIYNIYPDTKQIIREVENFNLDHHVDIVYSKLKHPTIDVAGCGLWHRRRTLDGNGFYQGKRKTNKVEIIPSMRYLRYFDDDIHFSARTMQHSVAYYEADHTVDDMGLYSALCRRIFHKNDDPTPRFPEPGFIYPVGTLDLISTPSTTSTTTPFFCDLLDTSKSYVWTDGKKYAILMQYQMKLPPLLPGMFSEVMCIFIEERRIEVHYRLEDASLTLYAGDKSYDRVPGNDVDTAAGYIIMNIDLTTYQYTSELGNPVDTERRANDRNDRRLGDTLSEFDESSRVGGRLLPKMENLTNGQYRARHDTVSGHTSSFFFEEKVNGSWVPHSYQPGEEATLLPEMKGSNGVTYYLDSTLNMYLAKN